MWHYNLYPRGSLYSLLCKSWKEPHTISAVSMHPIKVNVVSSENLAYCIANKQNVQKWSWCKPDKNVFAMGQSTAIKGSSCVLNENAPSNMAGMCEHCL